MQLDVGKAKKLKRDLNWTNEILREAAEISIDTLLTALAGKSVSENTCARIMKALEAAWAEKQASDNAGGGVTVTARVTTTTYEYVFTAPNGTPVDELMSITEKLISREVAVKRTGTGSVKVYIDLTEEEAEKIIEAIENGAFLSLGDVHLDRPTATDDLAQKTSRGNTPDERERLKDVEFGVWTWASSK